MPETSIIHSTFVIERNYPATPERVFAAFSDPVKKRRWFLEKGGHKLEHHEMDFRVGGKEQARIRFKEGTPVQGLECRNDSTYLDIVPNRRVVIAYAMTIAGNPISASLVTFELLPAENGTNLILTHQGAYFEGADGPKMREEGWQKLLGHLSAEFAT